VQNSNSVDARKKNRVYLKIIVTTLSKPESSSEEGVTHNAGHVFEDSPEIEKRKRYTKKKKVLGKREIERAS